MFQNCYFIRLSIKLISLLHSFHIGIHLFTYICCSCIFSFNRTSFEPHLTSNLWLISGEDGRSRAEQLLHILRQIDQYVSSPLEYQRKRSCLAVYEMLLKFKSVCVSGYCALGCHGSCTHSKHIDRTLHGNFSNLPCKFFFLRHLYISIVF